VSAVLGCAAVSQGCSSLLHGSCTDAARQQQLSDSAEAVAATADGPWQTIRSKRQGQQYNQGAQQQQQQFEGVSTLQRQVLLLLADCLGSAGASVESSGSTGSDTGVPLLQCTDDLLAGHALWLKLLYGLCIAVQQDTGLVAPNPISRSSSCVLCEHLRSTGVSHPVVCHIVSFVCSLTDQLQSGDIQISQLQQLQLRSEPLLQLTAAVHAMQVAAPAGHVAASNSSCNVAAVSAALAAAEAALQQHTHQQQLSESFYSLLCPSLGATADLDPHVADLSSIEVRLQQSHIRDLNSEAVWGMHWGKLPAAAQVEGLLGLTVFHNSVKQFAADMAVDMEAAVPAGDADAADATGVIYLSGQGMPDDTSMTEVDATGATPDSRCRRVADVAELIPLLLQHFAAQWAAAMELQTDPASSISKQGGPSVAAVLALWASEQAPDVAAEYAAVQCFFAAHQGTNSCTATNRLLPASAVAALLRLHCASRECTLAEQLEYLQPAFGLVASPLLAAVQLLPKQPLAEVQLPALQLAAAFEGVEEGLGQLSGQLGLL
jgi:hypothetical protein